MNIKRILAAAAALLLCSMPLRTMPEASVHCAALGYVDPEEEEYNGFRYYRMEDHIAVTGCDPTAVKLEIPETIDGLPVKEVYMSTFMDCTELTSVTLPKTITALQGSTFSMCPKLREIILPDTLTTFDRTDFEGTPWWEALADGKEEVVVKGMLLAVDTAVTDYIVPEGVHTIVNGAFEDCKALEKLAISSDVRVIQRAACLGCSSLSAVSFAEGLESIGSNAFANTALTEVVFPSTLKKIEMLAFQRCKSLRSVTLPEGLEEIHSNSFQNTPWWEELQGSAPFIVVSGILLSADAALTTAEIPAGVRTISAGVFKDNTALTSVTFPQGLTSISSNAFSGCTGLTRLTLPEGLRTIGQRAFADCTALEEISLPKGVERLEDQVFGGCSSLRTLTIPEGVTALGSFALSGCSGLKSLTLPSTLETLGSNVFRECSAMQSIRFSKENSRFSAVDNVLFDTEQHCLLYCPAARSGGVYEVPQGTERIGNYAFAGSTTLVNVRVPETVTSLGGYAFQNCTALKVLNLPQSVDFAGAGLVDGCSALERLRIPEGVTQLSTTCRGCTGLRELYLPKSLKTVYSMSFNACTPERICYAGSLSDWTAIDISEDGNAALLTSAIAFAQETPATEVELYTIMNGRELPSGLNGTYQIQAGSGAASFRIVCGSSVTVSETGLVQPTETFGTTCIEVTDGGKRSFLRVHTQDYTQTFADDEIDRYLAAHVTQGMEATALLEVLCQYPASFDYRPEYCSYPEMIAFRGGDCIASSELLVEMCRRLGIPAWRRNGNRDPNAGNRHTNVVAMVEGKPYVLEAGYSGTAPRLYTVTGRSSLFACTETEGGLCIYQYDLADTAEGGVTIPAVLDGQRVVAIGDSFLLENPWIHSVSIPKTVTSISETAFPDFDGVFYVEKGSAAEEYAKKRKIAYRYLKDTAPLGDVNVDGTCSVADAVMLQKALLGSGVVTDRQAADLNGDGEIDVFDLAELKRLLASK